LGHAFRRHLQHRHEQLQQMAHTLHALSPLATLERGYAIVLGPDGAVVRHARAVHPGQPVTAKLGQGSIECRVEKCRED
jgi:exodeoxyribonuclease VII large subunit